MEISIANRLLLLHCMSCLCLLCGGACACCVVGSVFMWWGLCLCGGCLFCCVMDSVLWCGVVSDEISVLRSDYICFGSFLFFSSSLFIFFGF